MELTQEQQAYVDSLRGSVSNQELAVITRMLGSGRPMEEVRQYADTTMEQEARIHEADSASNDLYDVASMGNDFRKSGKEYLRLITEQYERNARDLDPELKAILADIRRYAEIDVVATSHLTGEGVGTVEEEAALFNRITKDLTAYEENLRLNHPDPDEEFVENGETGNFRDTYTVVYNMVGFFEGQRTGNLTADLDERDRRTQDPNAETEGYFIDATGQTFESADRFERSATVEDMPLFSHDPSPSDIEQLGLGDCYLMAGLSELARRNPQAIRDSMRDNGKTVTVRFWQRIENTTEPNGADTYRPVYVTVDKKTPGKGSAQNCCWAQMLERAYVASGLHRPKGRVDKYAEPRPHDLQERYEAYRKMSPEDRPTMQECPWLFDSAGNLRTPQPSYRTIEGGNSGPFLAAFMGEDYTATLIDPEDYISPKISTRDAIKQMKDRFFADYGLPSPPDQPKSAYERAVATLEYKILHGRDAVLPLVKDARGNDTAATEPGSFLPIGTKLSALFSTIDGEAGPKPATTLGTRLTNAINQSFGSLQPITGDENERNALAVLKDRVMQEIPETQDAVLGEPFTGQYTAKSERLYEQLRELTEDRKVPVTAGTYGVSDKNNKEGLYESHAYSVLGVEEQELGGKNLKFIRVRNPHGENGRKYTVGEDGKIRRERDRACRDGEFLVELDDFIHEFEEVYYNAPETVHRHSARNQRIAPETASKYNRIAMNLRTAIRDTDSYFSRDSDEYKHFKAAIEEYVADTSNNARGNRSDLRKQITPLSEAADAYELHLLKVCYPDYTNMDPHPTEVIESRLSSRERARFQVLKAVRDLSSLEVGSALDPKAGLQQKLTEKIAGTMMEKYRDDPRFRNVAEAYGRSPEAKRQICEQFRNLPAMKKLFANAGFCELSRLSRQSGEKCLSIIKSDIRKAADMRVAPERAQPENRGPEAGENPRRPDAQPGRNPRGLG